mmetsp:Transcript_17618/g.26372  ORF Transcript_17618/g.26372 Transcript_17618/m.26372 type:complete len:230 (+) Transcript_17618:1013-1702(+)
MDSHKEVIIRLKWLLVWKERREGKGVTHEFFVCKWINRFGYTKCLSVSLQNVNEVNSHCVILNFEFLDQPIYLVPHLVPQFKGVGVAVIIDFFVTVGWETFLFDNELFPETFPGLFINHPIIKAFSSINRQSNLSTFSRTKLRVYKPFRINDKDRVTSLRKGSTHRIIARCDSFIFFDESSMPHFELGEKVWQNRHFPLCWFCQLVVEHVSLKAGLHVVLDEPGVPMDL